MARNFNEPPVICAIRVCHCCVSSGLRYNADRTIIDEVRRHREAHAASLDYDLKRITKDFQRQELESGREVVTRPPRKPSAVRRPSTA